MPITVGARPAGLDGCWQSWTEQDLDVVARTDFESGNVRTRRRFTGVQRLVQASVTLPTARAKDFKTWFRTNQRQGAIATRVMTPEGTEEVFQFLAPPQFTYNINGTVRIDCELWQGSDF